MNRSHIGLSRYFEPDSISATVLWSTDSTDIGALNWDTTETCWTDSVSGMFEGSIRFDSCGGYDFEGEISLSVPDDPGGYIDTGKYHMLSFGITVSNPWRYDDNACSVLLRWKDSRGEWGCNWYGVLGTHGYSISNGWDGWSVIGSVDLREIDSLYWGNDTASELWLRLQSNAQYYPFPPDYPDSIDVRIGWIRLEESGE